MQKTRVLAHGKRHVATKPPMARSAGISGRESTPTKAFRTVKLRKGADAFCLRRKPNHGPGFAALCNTAEYVRKVHAGPGTRMKNPGFFATTTQFRERTACA